METVKVYVGDVRCGSQRSDSFELPNPTGYNRTISRVDMTCTCMAADWVGKVVGPNSTLPLTLRYQVPQIRGPFAYSVLVHYQETEVVTSVLLMGEASGWFLSIEPRQLDFGEVCWGDTKELSLVVTLTEAWPLERHHSQLNFDHASFPCSPLDNSYRKFVYTVSFRPPVGAEVGVCRGSLSIGQRDDRQRRLLVPCFARVVSPCAAQPPVINFGIVPRGQIISKTVVVTPSDRSPIETLKLPELRAYSDVDTLHATLTAETDHSVTMLVELDASEIAPGQFIEGTVLLENLHTKNLLLRLPISAFVQ